MCPVYFILKDILGDRPLARPVYRADTLQWGTTSQKLELSNCSMESEASGDSDHLTADGEGESEVHIPSQGSPPRAANARAATKGTSSSNERPAKRIRLTAENKNKSFGESLANAMISQSEAQLKIANGYMKVKMEEMALARRKARHAEILEEII